MLRADSGSADISHHVATPYGPYLHWSEITINQYMQSPLLVALTTLNALHVPLQEVIDNLMISAIQYRSETDPDIQPHVHQRCVDERVVQPTREVDYCKQTLIHVIQDVLTSLARMKVGVLHLLASVSLPHTTSAATATASAAGGICMQYLSLLCRLASCVLFESSFMLAVWNGCLCMSIVCL